MKADTTEIQYKYGEGKYLEELTKYVNRTYNEHYSKEKIEALEFIIDSGNGQGFNIGNVLKYAKRYGKKGDVKEWRKDLLKIAHYALIQLHVHDLQYGETNLIPILESNKGNVAPLHLLPTTTAFFNPRTGMVETVKDKGE